MKQFRQFRQCARQPQCEMH